MEGRTLRPLISRDRISEVVARLGWAISRDYAGRNLVLVGVLKGAFVFLADLARTLSVPVKIDFVRIGSYGVRQESSGAITVTKEVEIPLRGLDVLIVEDIVDTGLSLAFLVDYLAAQQPSSLKICVLVDKKSRREVEVAVDYVGFEIEDGFIVGYGLDCAEEYRALPGLFVLE